jgi:prophage antirepressor-like protein
MEKEIVAISKQIVLGKEFEIYGDFENPLFLAKDVAEWIETQNVSQMLSKIDEDEKLIYKLYISGQNRDCWFVTENGLYEILMLSTKPIAKQFKKAIKELLHSLRTNKAVIVSHKTKEELENERKMLNLEAYNALHSLAELYRPKNESYGQILDAYATKELSGEFLLPLPETEKTYSATDIAKMLNVSSNFIGKIANKNNLKNKEYGMYVMDKSKYSTKEVQTFRYNEKGFNRIKELVMEA